MFIPVARRIPKPSSSGVCMRICAKKESNGKLVQGSVRVLHQTLTKKRINKLDTKVIAYQEKNKDKLYITTTFLLK